MCDEPTRLLLTGVPGVGMTHVREVPVAGRGYFALRGVGVYTVSIVSAPVGRARPRPDAPRRRRGDRVVVQVRAGVRKGGLRTVRIECDYAVARERFLRRGKVSR